MTVVGRRGVDERTGTYVKTLAITFVWFPLFLVRAYLVADSPYGGWHFIGKEPLSDFARAWNLVGLGVVIAVLISIARL